MHHLFRPSLIAVALTIGFFAGTATEATPVLSGQVCSQNVSKMTNEISWTRDLKDAQERAAQEDKLVLWVHMVGKMEGDT